MLENCDKIMHLRFNFDSCPMHSLFGFVHLTHQNVSTRALFCHNSLAKVNAQLLIYNYPNSFKLQETFVTFKFMILYKVQSCWWFLLFKNVFKILFYISATVLYLSAPYYAKTGKFSISLPNEYNFSMYYPYVIYAYMSSILICKCWQVFRIKS